MKALVIFDCDGVVYRGNQRLPHVRETFQALRKNSIPVRFITNNSTRARRDYLEKLRGMGIGAELGEIQSSARASRVYLDGVARPGARVLVVGERGISDELRDGFTLVSCADWDKAEYVVVGMDRKFTYAKLEAAMLAVLGGAVLIVTNRDPTFPLEGGALLPGGGAVVAAIETAAGKSGLLIGKPEPLMIRQALADAGVAARNALLVGDRPSTDILSGRRAGVCTLLTLAGVTSPKEVSAIPSAYRPDFVASDVRGVLDILGLPGASIKAVTWRDFKTSKSKSKGKK